MSKMDFSRLDELSKILAQREYWEKKKKSLFNTLYGLSQEDLRLTAQLNKETNDYEALETMSLKKLFGMLSKDFEAKKDKEYQEMKIAAYKHSELQNEIEHIKHEIEKTQAELQKLEHVEVEYQELLKNKLSIASVTHADAISTYESRIFEKKKIIKEINEAIDALNALALSLKSAEEGLSSAKSWGLYDIFAGGLISSVIKHDHIERAASYLKDASNKAATFKRELTDIDIPIHYEFIEIDQLTKSFDIFFDNIFADLSIQEEINRAYTCLINHITKTSSMAEYLKTLLKETENSVDSIIKERNEYVCKI